VNGPADILGVVKKRGGIFSFRKPVFTDGRGHYSKLPQEALGPILWDRTGISATIG
tara:strand:- start:21564 stop:21731 length:168 start_codon:yes stop_codon:yes gene_type:complete